MEFSDLVERIGKAASLPMVVQEVIKVCSNPMSDPEDICNAISKDPVITANVLRVANSAFFGFISKTTTLRDALSRLGTSRIRSLVAATGMIKVVGGDETDIDGYSRVNVWKHSVAVAVYAEAITRHSGDRRIRQLSGESMLTGITHDIGIILLDQYVGSQTALISAVAFSMNQALCVQERETFGFDHSALGQAVLRKWRLPGNVADAIGGHHGLESDDGLTNVVMLAEQLSTNNPVGYCDLLAGPDRKKIDRLMESLGLSGQAMERIEEQFKEQIDDAIKIFEPRKGHKAAVQFTRVSDSSSRGMAAKYRQPSGPLKRYAIA